MSKMESGLQVSRAVAQLYLTNPYFGSICMSVDVREAVDGLLPDGAPCNTMATDGRSIYWNPTFVAGLSDGEIKGVLMHECCHIMLLHFARAAQRDSLMWNVATDLVINPKVFEWGGPLPAIALMPTRPPFKDLGITQAMTAEQVYALLPDIELPGTGLVGDVFQPTDENGKALSPSETDALIAEVKQKLENAAARAKSIGKLPGGVEELINDIKPPQVPWSNRLRFVLGGDGAVESSPSRMAKRFYYQTNVMGAGLIGRRLGKLVVGIDTSWSVTTPEHAQALGELNNITSELNPEMVTVIYCDSVVQRVAVYEDGETIESLDVKGRGGTCVTPVFDWIAENHHDDIDYMIYFSDMEVNDIPKDPPPYPVIWVNTDSRSGVTAPWGENIKIDRRGS